MRTHRDPRPDAPPDAVPGCRSPGDAHAEALAAISAAGLDPSFPSSADRERLAASTGWSGAHLDEAVRRAFAPFTPAACRRLVAAGAVATRREARPGGMAPGPFPASRTPVLLVLVAGRVPAVAASALFLGLAARHSVVLKPSSAEPVFATLLARLVARVAPPLAPHVRVLDVPSGDPSVTTAVESADAVLAYGSDATIAAVRDARAGRPLLAGAHRESAVVCFRDALSSFAGARRVAGAIARDAALYDQSGCLSPQTVLVESGAAVTPDAFARMLHEALVAAAHRLPPGPVPLEALAAVRMLVEESRLPGPPGGLVLPASGPVPPAVVLLPPGRPVGPAPGFRVLQVLPFRGEPDLDALLPHLSGCVQGLAVAGDRRRLAAALARAPSFVPARVCAPGRLQDPPAGWRENGIDVVRALAGCTATPILDGTPGVAGETGCA